MSADDKVLLLRPENVAAATGFCWPLESWPSPQDIPIAALIEDGDITLLVPDVLVEDARKALAAPPRVYPAYAPGVAVFDPHESFQRALDELIGHDGAVADQPVSHPRVRYSPETAYQWSLRRAMKSPPEIEGVKRTASLCDLFLSTCRSALEDSQGDLTELELYYRARQTVEQAAGERLDMMVDLVAEPCIYRVGGPPTPRRIGDSPLLVDVSIRFHGFWADTCSTFRFGLAKDKHQTVFTRVEAVLNEVPVLLTPGKTGGEVAEEILNRLAMAGFETPHHLGHGVGRSYHELPRIVPGDPTVLAEGMTISVEPALFNHQVGVRLEDVFMVRTDGSQRLSRFSHRVEA